MKIHTNNPRGNSAFVSLLIALLFAISFSGCGETTEDSDDENKAEVRGKAKFVVIEDEPLANALERQLNARANLDALIVRMNREELQSQTDGPLKADVIIYPVDMLDWMIENEMLISLPEKMLESPEMANNDILQVQRNVVSQIGSRQYAISLGSPALVLVYRKDIFDELKIEAPKTWADYQIAVEKIDAKLVEDDGNSKLLSATCEPLAENWAAQMLLARVAAYIRQFGTYSTLFDIDSMEPQIDKPPFVEALKELVAAAKTSKSDWTQVGPANAEQMMLDGKCAMAICWPTKNRRRAEDVDGEKHSITIASMPGSNRVFQYRSQSWSERPNGETASVPMIAMTGRLASVSRGSQQSSFSLQMLSLIAGHQLSTNVSPESDSVAPFRTSQLGNAANWISSDYSLSASSDYATVLKQWDEKNLYLQALRVPGTDEYLAELSKAIRAAVDGADPEQSLKDAAERWKEITEKRGLEKQRTAYNRCLGINN